MTRQTPHLDRAAVGTCSARVGEELGVLVGLLVGVLVGGTHEIY